MAGQRHQCPQNRPRVGHQIHGLRAGEDPALQGELSLGSCTLSAPCDKVPALLIPWNPEPGLVPEGQPGQAGVGEAWV